MKIIIQIIATVLGGLLIGMSNIKAQNFVGDWYGTMDVQGMQLEIVFHIEETAGVYTATFDSPLQGAFGIPFTSTKVEETELTVIQENMGASFDGSLIDEKISGVWKQSGSEFELILSKEKVEIVGPNRPQEPTKPYPYNEEDVRFTNSVDQIDLAGTLTLPHSGSSFPAVILISGSGPQDRDETFMTHKPFLVLADHLTRNGIAVLRFDDRGFGESEGDHAVATSLDFATDVEAAVEYLSSRSEINPNQIGLAGHSEGGLIAPIVASRNDDVAFMILLAGPGVNGLEIQKQQVESFGPLMGLTTELIEVEKSNLEEIAEIVRTHEIGEELAVSLTTYFDERLGDVEEVQGMTKGDFIQRQIPELNRPWYKYFIDHEPTNFLSQVNIPTLAISGDKDIQVPPSNLEAIEDAISDKELITVIEYSGTNHLFQECSTCLMSEYAQIEETISPIVLADISGWIISITSEIE